MRLFDSFSLKENLVVVSWLPEVLFAVHELDKTIPLCFSHYPLVPGSFLKNIFLRINFHGNKLDNGHQIFYFLNKYNRTDFNKYTIENKTGDDFEHLATAPISGELLSMLQSVHGMVCCDMRFAGKKLVELYHKKGIRVALYSAKTESDIKKSFVKIKADLLLSDNPDLCFMQG